MSYSLVLNLPKCETCGHGETVDFGDITYNYGPAISEALEGGYTGLDGKKAADVLALLERAELLLREYRSLYDGLIRGGGQWGTIDSLLALHLTIVDAARKQPDGVFEVGP